ncbi:tetratricopeptide repeat protein [Pseudenhygromyxa sp. WMMC2535]|uniref:tetratricopeptide repeat protein n=1 Tax=Pseudenhygromyxa sp. WMMC2535 TaxID=2712867 RepID=UPI0015547CCE|nr:tetratricopeptide repeat protein [Pseudenhygromyxa sp. WMMC2535]NVB41782.1 tetratricopeptide repeat protein [Pseudenhygromyxa sp. WMMC2535]
MRRAISTWSRSLSLALVMVASLTTSACERGGGETEHPKDGGEDGEDEDLGDASLSGGGPGGIAEVTAGMASADPAIVDAEALIAKGEPARALELMDAAIVERPDHARFHYVRGNALSHLDRDDEAMAAYERAIALDPDDALPHAALGNLVGLRFTATDADKKAAIGHLQAALERDPSLADAHLALGVVLLDLGRLEDAAQALETAARLAPSVDTSYTLAQVYARLGDDARALEHAHSAIEGEPGAAGVDIRLLYARLLMKAARADEAAAEFEQVAKLVPDSPPLRLEVARGLLELGKLEQSEVHMRWLVDAVPDQAPVRVNYGRLLVAQGAAKDALAQFDEALKLDPESRAAKTYRIEALVAAKRCKDARDALAQLSEALGKQHRAVEKAKAWVYPRCK